MEAVAQLQQLGWQWRPDGAGTGAGPGVLFTVRVSGRTRNVFVPLQRVWVTFDQELQRVGCPSAASVGAPFSVGGFFSFIKKAVSNVAKKVVPKAIRNAAAKVANIAKKATLTTLRYAMKPAELVARATRNIPVLGTITRAGGVLANLPAHAASDLVSGRRLDHIAVGQFKDALGATRELAPYVQTVVSFVPGLGTGISAGIGGALALAEGKPITEALISAAKSSLPGGPAAQAAFNVAHSIAQHKPLDQIALAALPISDSAKRALVIGLGAAKDLAAGKRVDHVLLDNATKALPPTLQKAVQVGVALGHAKTLQGALGAAAQGAAQLAGNYANGVQAARLFSQGVRTPAVVNALHQAQASRAALTQIVQHAQQGHPQASHIVNAFQRFARVPSTPSFSRPALPAFTRPALPSFGHFPAFRFA